MASACSIYICMATCSNNNLFKKVRMEENSHGPLVSTHVRTLAYTLSHRVHTCTYTHTRIEEQKGREEIRNRDAWPLEESETLKKQAAYLEASLTESGAKQCGSLTPWE